MRYVNITKNGGSEVLELKEMSVPSMQKGKY